MTSLKCKQCECIVTEDLESLQDDKYIQCPTCSRIIDNPCWGEEE